MTIELTRSRPAEYLAARLPKKLVLVDAGCGVTGIAHIWRTLGSNIEAHGFDGDSDEIDRLVAANTSPDVHYYQSMLGLRPDHPYFIRQHSQGPIPYSRTRCSYWDTRLHKTGSAIPPFSPPRAWRASSRVTARPECADFREVLEGVGITALDYLKMDVDGSDALLLNSLGGKIREWGCLALKLETMFHQAPVQHGNLLQDLVDIICPIGFRLISIKPTRYASRALPRQYNYKTPASTANGRTIWADCLFAADPCDPQTPFYGTLSDDQLLKLALLLAIFDLPDWSAEVIEKHAAVLSDRIDIDEVVRLLRTQAEADWHRKRRQWVGSVFPDLAQRRARPFVERSVAASEALLDAAGSRLTVIQAGDPRETLPGSLVGSRRIATHSSTGVARPFATAIKTRVADPTTTFFFDPALVFDLADDARAEHTIDLIRIGAPAASAAALTSIAGLLDAKEILAIEVRVDADGYSPDGFGAINRWMTQAGFVLADLRFASENNPAIPASDEAVGRFLDAEVLYIRDLCSPIQADYAASLPAAKLLKSAAILAAYRLPDQAAEILLCWRQAVADMIPVEAILDLLAAQVQEGTPEPLTYEQWMEAFRRDDPIFYPPAR